MKKFYLVLLSLFFFFNISFSQNVPEWAKGIVWYQIFPERFANGDSTNDPSPEKVYAGRKSPEDWKIRKWTSNWFEKDVWEEKLGDPLQNHLYERRYGGDLQGIIDKLDYLKELGVKAIYFNPIFESISLHKYDASYYHHIDVEFGPSPKIDKQIINSENPEDKSTWKWTTADSLFLKLVDEVHKRGMRIVLDGVFNHVGTQFWAFKDLREKQEKSKYKDWFIVNEFDDPKTEKNEFEYKGWWGYWGMPEFNRTKENLNPEPSKYIFNSTNKWMDPNGDGNPSDGIDGWRLDVARDVPLGFWKDWSALVKKTNKNAIIIGELWELSPDFIAKDGPFDALMNYNFAFAVNDFFLAEKKKIDTEEFVERLQEIDNTYPADNLYVLQNLI
ncbi:MAG: alpha-amylase family glycosyl hydrolase, partial [Syntrophothermus sp.]